MKQVNDIFVISEAWHTAKLRVPYRSNARDQIWNKIDMSGTINNIRVDVWEMIKSHYWDNITKYFCQIINFHN
jgi:hypothetical protein